MVEKGIKICSWSWGVYDTSFPYNSFNISLEVKCSKFARSTNFTKTTFILKFLNIFSSQIAHMSEMHTVSFYRLYSKNSERLWVIIVSASKSQTPDLGFYVPHCSAPVTALLSLTACFEYHVWVYHPWTIKAIRFPRVAMCIPKHRFFPSTVELERRFFRKRHLANSIYSSHHMAGGWVPADSKFFPVVS